jgi:hypothetical protein
MTITPPPNPESDDYRARRVGYRLDWCATVELLLDNRPDLSLLAALDVIGGIYPNPFDSYDAYKGFMKRERPEVTLRKAEIWQYLNDVEETRRYSEGATESIESELTGLVGVRITERFTGLGMTHIPEGRPPTPAPTRGR